MHWLTKSWWKYLFLEIDAKNQKFWRTVGCRRRGHCNKLGEPYGVIFYNPNGWEPDMTCLNCGDDLG